MLDGVQRGRRSESEVNGQRFVTDEHTRLHLHTGDVSPEIPELVVPEVGPKVHLRKYDPTWVPDTFFSQYFRIVTACLSVFAVRVAEKVARVTGERTRVYTETLFHDTDSENHYTDRI